MEIVFINSATKDVLCKYSGQEVIPYNTIVFDNVEYKNDKVVFDVASNIYYIFVRKTKSSFDFNKIDISVSEIIPYGNNPQAYNGVPRDAYIQAMDLCREGKIIGAVKIIKEATGWGLREAKDFVDTNFR